MLKILPLLKDTSIHNSRNRSYTATLHYSNLINEQYFRNSFDRLVFSTVSIYRLTLKSVRLVGEKVIKDITPPCKRSISTFSPMKNVIKPTLEKDITRMVYWTSSCCALEGDVRVKTPAIMTMEILYTSLIVMIIRTKLSDLIPWTI